jgi:hypothetical protein
MRERRNSGRHERHRARKNVNWKSPKNVRRSTFAFGVERSEMFAVYNFAVAVSEVSNYPALSTSRRLRSWKIERRTRNLSQLGARMRLVVSLFNPFHRDMGVNLSGREVDMSE